MDVTLADGSHVRCEDSPFSQGGEGALYLSKDKGFVVKLYLHREPHRRSTLENILGKYNLVKEDPARAPFFGWPDALIVARDGSPALGIRMPRVRDALPLENFVRQAFWKTLPLAERGSWHSRVMIALRMARILRWMHNRGLCHSDLSPKNFLVDVKSGRATLIDCDGLVVPGLHPPGVLGTPQCMAPEIVMGKATPTVNTDKHALAVLIYWTFFLRHPLQGPKTHHQDDQEDERLAYGAKALFIEHPTDRSNRPASLPFTSELLTPLVRTLLHRSFVEGLHNAAKRPQASEWEAALLRMGDQVVSCCEAKCPMGGFVAPEADAFRCPWCGTPYRSPGGVLPLLRLYRPGLQRGTYQRDNWTVMGGHGIAMHHVDLRHSPDPGAPAVVMVRFQADRKGRWYLVNEGLDDVRLITPAGAVPFPRGTSLQIATGTKVVMGGGEHARAGIVDLVRTA